MCFPTLAFGQQRAISSLNEAYYDAGLLNGFSARLARYELKGASEQLQDYDSELSQKIRSFSRYLPEKKKCLDGRKTLTPQGDRLSTYLRNLSVQDEDVQTLLLNAALSFDRFDRSLNQLCIIEKRLCGTSSRRIDPEGAKLVLGAQLHKVVPAFRGFTKRWSRKKAMSYLVEMEKFSWQKLEDEMPRQVLLWWKEARSAFPGERRATEIVTLYEYFRIHAIVCADLYCGSEEPAEFNFLDSNDKLYVKLRLGMSDYIALKKPICKRTEVARKKERSSPAVGTRLERLNQQTQFEPVVQLPISPPLYTSPPLPTIAPSTTLYNVSPLPVYTPPAYMPPAVAPALYLPPAFQAPVSSSPPVLISAPAPSC